MPIYVCRTRAPVRFLHNDSEIWMKVTLKTELSTKQMAISSSHSFIHSCKESNVITLMMASEEKKSRLLCVLPGDVQVARRRCTERRLSKDRASEKRSVNVENITNGAWREKKRMTKVTDWIQTYDDTWFLIYYIASVCLTVQLSHCLSHSYLFRLQSIILCMS